MPIWHRRMEAIIDLNFQSQCVIVINLENALAPCPATGLVRCGRQTPPRPVKTCRRGKSEGMYPDKDFEQPSVGGGTGEHGSWSAIILLSVLSMGPPLSGTA